MKLHGGQLVHYKNGTVKVSFQLTSCGSLATLKCLIPDALVGRPTLPFQLDVHGINPNHVNVVLGFETEIELRNCEEVILKHILPH